MRMCHRNEIWKLQKTDVSGVSPSSEGNNETEDKFDTDRVNRHQPGLFRRYSRRRAFITKTRTIILNHLGSGVTATGHFHY